jgi:WD40 repeat protein
MGHTAIVPHGAFAPDGAHVATAGWDHTALIWTVRPGWASAFASDVKLSMATFAADGSVIASDDRGRIERHDAATGAARTSVDVGDGNNAWSRDGRLVAVVHDERAEIRALATGAVVAALPAEHVAGIAIDAAGTLAVTVTSAGAGEIWDIATGARRAGFDAVGVYSVRISDDGRLVVGFHDRVVLVWDAATGALLHEMTGHDGHVYDLALCAGGARAVTVSNDRTARVWDLERGTAIATLVGHTNVTLEADFTPDCAMVATASADGTVKLWDVATGRPLVSIDILAAGVSTVHVSPDGARLVTADYAGTVAVCDIAPETRPAAEIVDWVRCHVPFRASAGRLELAAIDPGCPEAR